MRTGTIKHIFNDCSGNAKKQSDAANHKINRILLAFGGVLLSPAVFAACDVPSNPPNGSVITCTGNTTGDYFVNSRQNISVTNEGDWTISGTSAGNFQAQGDMSGLSFTNNGTMTWLDAVYEGPGTGTRNVINVFTDPNTASSLSAINNGELLLTVSADPKNDRHFGVMSLYTSNVNGQNYWENDGQITIESSASKLGAKGSIAGGVIWSAENHAINRGEIKLQSTGTLDLIGLALVSTKAASGKNSTLTNSGSIVLDNQNQASEALGVELRIRGTNTDSTPSSLSFDNSGTVKINHSSVNARVVDIEGSHRDSTFNLNNSGKILAANEEDISIFAIGDASNDNNVFVNIENTNEILGRITTQNTTDKIIQTAGSMRGDISLGSGNDILHASGGLLAGKILMGEGDDEIKLENQVNISAIPQLDGGLGTDSLYVNNMALRGFTAASNDGTGNLAEANNINLTGWETISLSNSQFTVTGDVFTAANPGSLQLSNNAILSLDSSKTSPTTIYGDAFNSNSTITLNNNRLGDTLSIAGNYTSDNGSLLLETHLGDDSSATDKLVIQGQATGKTELKLKNLNGQGAYTDKGIHVIQTGLSEASNTFFLAGNYVSAGAYDYSLNLRPKNTEKNDSGFDNWYLESKLSSLDPTPTPPTPKPTTPVYSPNVGSYIANELMGNTLFNTRLEDREGASHYQEHDQKSGNIWMRAYGNHHKFRSMSDQLQTKGDSFVTQVGVALLKPSAENQFNIGLMGGYAHYSGDTYSNLTNRKSSSKVHGYSLGLYGTWYANPENQRGLYVDTWVLWNQFKNRVSTADGNQRKYNSSGLTASVELGNNYLINDYGNKTLWVQPQAQLIYQGVHANDFRDDQGVKITHGNSNIQTRLGVKTYLEIPTDSSANTNYRPYLALNYIHNTNPHSVKINGAKYKAQGARNLGEVKLGLEGMITKNSQVWINAGYVFGKSSYQTYQGNIGWKYNF